MNRFKHISTLFNRKYNKKNTYQLISAARKFGYKTTRLYLCTTKITNNVL